MPHSTDVHTKAALLDYKCNFEQATNKYIYFAILTASSSLMSSSSCLFCSFMFIIRLSTDCLGCILRSNWWYIFLQNLHVGDTFNYAGLRIKEKILYVIQTYLKLNDAVLGSKRDSSGEKSGLYRGLRYFFCSFRRNGHKE